MTYLIIKLQGKQFKVTPGDTIIVDRMDGKVGDNITISDVLLSVNDDKVQVGTPTLTDVPVTAKIVEHLRGEKIRVATFKAKSRFRKVKGHRQDQTKLEILGDKPKKSKAAAKSE